MDVIFVYMTAGSVEEARRIARALVDERLAACVNLIEGMTAIYRWQGGVEEAGEVVLIAKTCAGQFEALAGRVRTLHSYAVPCIVELPVGRGNPAYMAWLRQESGA